MICLQAPSRGNGCYGKMAREGHPILALAEERHRGPDACGDDRVTRHARRKK
jgi:hypothetical protein